MNSIDKTGTDVGIEFDPEFNFTDIPDGRSEQTGIRDKTRGEIKSHWMRSGVKLRAPRDGERRGPGVSGQD